MNDLEKLSPEQQRFSAAELKKLPASERSGILEAQAELADGYYRKARDLTSFEAFGEDDLDVDGSFTEAG